MKCAQIYIWNGFFRFKITLTMLNGGALFALLDSENSQLMSPCHRKEKEVVTSTQSILANQKVLNPCCIQDQLQGKSLFATKNWKGYIQILPIQKGLYLINSHFLESISLLGFMSYLSCVYGIKILAIQKFDQQTFFCDPYRSQDSCVISILCLQHTI